MKRYITYAYRNHIPVSIDEVESGLACNCVCPFCKTKLIAKKGNIRIHHFAHADASECERAYEASLQLMVKDILTKKKKICIPAVSIHFHSFKHDESVSSAQNIPLDHVELENPFDDKVPDTVVYAKTKDGKYRKFYIVIQVNHTINEEKKQKIRNTNVSVILIDVSQYNDTISYPQMMTILLRDSDDKRWLCNEIAKKYYDLFIRASETKKFLHSVNTLQVEACPITGSQADVLYDCRKCDYCIVLNEKKGYLRCTGKNLISSVSDFSISFQERKQKYEEMLRMEEERKQRVLEEMQKRMQMQEEERRQRESYFQKMVYEERNLRRKEKEDGYNSIKDQNFEQNDHQIRDAYDQRWVRCEVCGKIKPADEFISYGGRERMNQGICNECAKTYDPETGEYRRNPES